MLPTFPSSKDVPFPYSNPYPQQLALMDAVLNSLRLIEEKIDMSYTPRSVSNQDKRQHRPAILMLESPTGTGKSLSLCCSALAWLDYVNQRDIAVDLDQVTHSLNGAQTSSQQHDGSEVDWINSWQSPEELYVKRLSNDVRRRAMTTRNCLDRVLEDLRSGKDAKCSKNQDRSITTLSRRMRALRIALAHVDANLNKKRKRSKLASISSAPNKNGDFCLDAYHSGDDDVAGAIEPNSCSSISLQYDSNENERNECGPYPKLIPISSKLNNPETLLKGELLDGSIELKFMKPLSLNKIPTPVAGVFPGSGVRKIIYAARTHSQLSQFVLEFARTPFAASHRIVALGGRKTLCSNPTIFNLSSESAITDACLELKNTCPHRSSSESLATLALHTLAFPTPIEESSQIGRDCCTCGYYAARVALPGAHVVVVPYTLLLSPRSREAIGLCLKECLVIVDEAHNLPEILRSLHSATLTLPVVECALDNLSNYVRRYSQRMAGRTLSYLGQIARLLKSISNYLKNASERATIKHEYMLTPEDLMTDMRLENLNLYKLFRFIECTRLSQKLIGFRSHQLNQSKDVFSKDETHAASSAADREGTLGISKHVSAMSIVQVFLEKLSLSGQEGKVVVDVPRTNPGKNDSVRISQSPSSPPALRYVLLRPASFLSDVLKQAHAVALVGGTLSPFAHIAAELLGSEGDWIKHAAEADRRMLQRSSDRHVSAAFTIPRFTAFSCDHVVSSNNVLLRCVSKGPSKRILDFRHHSRSQPSTCEELGGLIKKVCRIVPHGVVVFLPCYSYENLLVNYWNESGQWNELSLIKKVHREPKNPSLLDSSLKSFAGDATSCTGALLFSVIGGKMSEGINFSDDMARCVIVVGLPYPDKNDPVLKEKMTNLDSVPNNTISGRDYYQNLCLRAVNQSVGRAIRHAQDFAAVLLVDARYGFDSRIWDGLPRWLKKDSSSQTEMANLSLDHHLERLNAFFHDRRSSAKRIN